MTAPRSQYDLDADAMAEGYESDADRRAHARQQAEDAQEFEWPDDEEEE